MNSIRNHPWLAASSLLLLAALPASNAPAADELTFHSVAGRKLEKKFVQHSVMKLVEVKQSAETPDGPHEQVGEEGLEITDDESIEFTDETLTAGEGQPKKVKRTYTTIENTTTFDADDDEADAEAKNQSGLLGKSVVFTWDADEKEFSAAWSESEGDDELLESLVEDADFRGWLPGKKVSEGDTWTIPGAEFNNLQEPSGPMGYHAEGEDREDDALTDGLRTNRKGDIKATYKGTREEDGVKLGVIAFEAKLSSTAETDTDQEEGPTVHQTTDVSDELEGELLWDIAGGHFQTLSCDSAIKLKSSNHFEFDIEEGSIKLTQTRSFEGTKTYRFSCAAKKD